MYSTTPLFYDHASLIDGDLSEVPKGVPCVVKSGRRHSNQILILCVFACASDEVSKSPFHKQVSVHENIVSYTSSPDYL